MSSFLQHLFSDRNINSDQGTFGNTTDAVGPDTSRPLGMNYNEIVKTMYRVKTFRLIASATVNFVGGSTGSYTYNFTFNLGGGSPLSEADLIVYTPGMVWSGAVGSEMGLVGRQNTGPLETAIENQRSVYDYGAAIYWPNFRIFGSPPATGGFVQLNTIQQAGFTNSPSTGTFVGVPFNFYYRYGAASVISVTSRVWHVDADSYFEYDPGDGGGPVWNATTGAQIRTDLPGLA